MASHDHHEESDERRGSPEGGSSVRVAIAVFLGTLLVLAAMGVYWLIIRV